MAGETITEHHLNSDMTTFTDRLKAVRKRMALSQAAFAELAGISLGSQNNYERGEQAPTASYFLKLAEMGVDMNFLLGRIHVDSDEARENALLTDLYNQMPPAQRATAFAIMNLLAQGGAPSAASTTDAKEIWRASLLYGQFLGMDQAGKAMVECVAREAVNNGAAPK